VASVCITITRTVYHFPREPLAFAIASLEVVSQFVGHVCIGCDGKYDSMGSTAAAGTRTVHT
jgi:hypothetical protein